MKYVRLRFLRTLVSTIVNGNSVHVFTRPGAVWNEANCTALWWIWHGLKIEPSRGQVRHNVLARTASSRCIFEVLLLTLLFRKHFFEILLANYSHCEVTLRRGFFLLNDNLHFTYMYSLENWDVFLAIVLKAVFVSFLARYLKTKQAINDETCIITFSAPVRSSGI